MHRLMKRILLVVAVVILVPVISFGALMVVTFSGHPALIDGAELPGGARTMKDGYVAAFMLPISEKEVALIDCGNDPKGAAVLAELKRRSLGPEAVTQIFLTHGHPDHIGACHLFAQAKVYGFAADAALADGSGRAKGPLPGMMSTPEEVRTKITDALTDGQVVTSGPLTVKAFAIPGHTAGSAAYLSGGTLFVGDSATGKTDGTMEGAPWIFSDDQAQNVASVEAVAQRLAAEHDEVKAIAFAHSGSFTGDSALKNFHASK